MKFLPGSWWHQNILSLEVPSFRCELFRADDNDRISFQFLSCLFCLPTGFIRICYTAIVLFPVSVYISFNLQRLINFMYCFINLQIFETFKQTFWQIWNQQLLEFYRIRMLKTLANKPIESSISHLTHLVNMRQNNDWFLHFTLRM